MYEIASETVKTFPLDHHGLVAATCKELKIAERIDALLKPHDKRVVSPGQSVVAMILNGLGFTNRRMYLTSQFFESKPVEDLLDTHINSSDLTDYTLGHTLDEISEYGSSDLFAKVAYDIALENDLLGGLNHLDTTTISVHGQYSQSDDLEPCSIELTHGHSKDHRPDLKQAVLSLVVNGPSNIPLWMEGLNGNSSDKASFQQTIKKVRAFQQQIDIDSNIKWVADSALYNKDKLLSNNDYLWLTRVPETIKEAKTLLNKEDKKIQWCETEGGYKYCSYSSTLGGVKQRWLLVFSQKAFEREKKTLERKYEKQEASLKKLLWHLSSKEFNCEADAEQEIAKLQKKHLDFIILHSVIPLLRYERRGKPQAGDEKVLKGFKLETTLQRDEDKAKEELNRKGRFILATNDLDKESTPDEKILFDYKKQQNVEQGFRFLKDPWFMLDSVFLKSPNRIDALMMVMTLCLLVYNVSQYRLRKRLKEQKETLPNQLGKEVENPTVRWVFQIMEGVGLLFFYEQDEKMPVRKLVTNLTDLRKKIIQLWGPVACKMYGLNPEKSNLGLGM